MPTLDKQEITNCKHQITIKFQITISKSQILSNTNCLEFWTSVIVICPSTCSGWWGGESFDFAQDREPVERLVDPFGICELLVEIF